MVELLKYAASWQTLLIALVIYGFAPGFALRLLVKLYPKDDPRRHELVAEMYAVNRLWRPFWVADALGAALVEGFPNRIRNRKVPSLPNTPFTHPFGALAVMTDPRVLEQIRALPDEVKPDLAAVYDLLELAPLTGPPYNIAKPQSPMRLLEFAASRGLVTYLAFEDHKRVDVLDVTWLG